MSATIPLYSRASDLRTFLLSDGCEAAWLLKHLYPDETPDTSWFALGTGLHEAFEACILHDLDLDQLLGEAEMNLRIAVHDSAAAGMIENTARTAKRTKATMFNDAERIATKWYNNVHPDGNARNVIFEDYEWPPKVEHEIKLTPRNPDLHLYTTVDAIFVDGKFGEEVMIVDWKTGNSKTAAASQLQTYFYGGRKEGWIDKRQDLLVGRFWHCEHEKDQPVFDYVGDQVVENWICRTAKAKAALLDSQRPVYNPGWVCRFCPSKQHCPVMGGGDVKSIGNRLAEADVIYAPAANEGEK